MTETFEALTIDQVADEIATSAGRVAAGAARVRARTARALGDDRRAAGSALSLGNSHDLGRTERDTRLSNSYSTAAGTTRSCTRKASSSPFDPHGLSTATTLPPKTTHDRLDLRYAVAVLAQQAA